VKEEEQEEKAGENIENKREKKEVADSRPVDTRQRWVEKETRQNDVSS